MEEDKVRFAAHKEYMQKVSAKCSGSGGTMVKRYRSNPICMTNVIDVGID